MPYLDTEDFHAWLICWQSLEHFPLKAFVRSWKLVQDSAPKASLAVGLSPLLLPTDLAKKSMAPWTWGCSQHCYPTLVPGTVMHSTENAFLLLVKEPQGKCTPSLQRFGHGKSETEPRQMWTSNSKCCELILGKKYYSFVFFFFSKLTSEECRAQVICEILKSLFFRKQC